LLVASLVKYRSTETIIQLVLSV